MVTAQRTSRIVIYNRLDARQEIPCFVKDRNQTDMPFGITDNPSSASSAAIIHSASLILPILSAAEFH